LKQLDGVAKKGGKSSGGIKSLKERGLSTTNERREANSTRGGDGEKENATGKIATPGP